MIRPRSQATALILAGLAAAASFLWLRNPALPIAGAFLVASVHRGCWPCAGVARPSGSKNT
jgi:hypothetical protein